MNRYIPYIAALMLSGLHLASPAHAVSDATGDFLTTHTGPNNSDLDIEEAEVVRRGRTIFFGAALSGEIKQTPGASYVWGIDRGAGVPGLFTGTPPVGPGVTFDAVLVLRANRTGTLTVFNEAGAPTVTNLTENVFAFDRLLGAILSPDLLPSRGFDVANYRYNLWTRSGGGNVGIADLARESGTFTAVPEPQSWALMIGGLGLAGWRARKRGPRVVLA